MGFMERFKAKGRGHGGVATAELSPFDEMVVPHGGAERAPTHASTVSLDMHPSQATRQISTSIISEAAPSELAADFSESRPHHAAPMAVAALPLIGKKTVPQQQRILGIVVLTGLMGLVLGTVLALSAANRGASQVAAVGQALMQSQRLAKSVSQALVGSAQAFPEVRDASTVLANNVRGLRNGEGELAAAPASVQDAVEPLLPLVDRAERNANHVLGQQKTLTQVGQALRTINRQSADLLETAETVSSLKLQQEATPAELAAVGQLVMLTQRIGKSANEFLTIEGVSPEAVFLLGKDLNSFREIAEGLNNGNPELRLPGTKDAQTKERLKQLIKQYDETRAQASSILGNLQGLVTAREAQAGILNDSEPLRKGLETLQDQLNKETGIRASHLGLMVFA